VAILPVMLLHVGATVLPKGRLLFELTRGWYGVDLFFVLSGFLITWILSGELEATGTIDLKRFYSRRVLRLGPAYTSMLIAVLAGAILLRRPEVARVPKVIPALVTYTYNYQIALNGPHFDVLVALWSLCVEEQFYLLWPMVLRRIGLKRALPFSLGAIASLAAYRAALYCWLNWGHLAAPSPNSSVWIYFATDTRIGVILMGCAAALSLRHRCALRMWRWIRKSRIAPETAVVLTSLVVVFVTGGAPSSGSWRSATFGYTLDAGVTAVMIGAVFIRPASIAARALSWSPLVALGRISYGVYLFHGPIAWLLIHEIPAPAWSAIASGFSVEVANAASIALPQASLSIEPATAEFGVASAMVVILTSVAAGLHYRYVERWFLARRASRPVA